MRIFIDKAIFHDLEVGNVESSSSTLVWERNPRISVYNGMCSETLIVTAITRSEERRVGKECRL